MRPTHLRAHCFRTYQDLDVTFPDGLFAILGENVGTPGTDSNGSGKSSILEAVEIALFGRRSLAPYLTRGVTDEELLIELEFEHGSEPYRVRRTYSPRGRGKTTVDFEQRLSDGWEPLTRESAKETQALIDATIGLSRETYRNSVYLRQGDGSFADPSRDPRERKQLLADVLGLRRYDTLREQARTDAAVARTRSVRLAATMEQAQTLAATLPGLEGEHAVLLEEETIAADNVADLERSRAQVADEYTQAREHASRLQAAQAEWQTAHSALEVLKARDAEARQAGGRAVLLRAEHATLAETGDLQALQARQAELAQQVAAYAGIVREREYAQRVWLDALAAADRADSQCESLREQIAALREADDPTCQTCGQTLPDDARERAALSYADELVQALAHSVEARSRAAAIQIPDEPAAPPREELTTVSEQLAAAQAQQTRRATLEERIRQLEKLADAGPTDDELTAAETLLIEKRDAVTAVGTPPDLAAITAQGELVAAQLRSAQAQLNLAQTEKARVEERLTAARDAATQVEAAQAQQQTLQAELDLLAALDRAFSPNGIPALILENSAIPSLETDANRTLQQLGCSYTVELRTQAALKSGDGVRDTLDVVIVDEHGQEAPFEECASGGEKTRIGLALRIALARLLAHRRGAESRALFLDEPSFLDEAGMAALLDVLRGLQTDFDLIALVSHIPALRDSFDTTLTVVKEDGRSRVVEAGVFEAVPA